VPLLLSDELAGNEPAPLPPPAAGRWSMNLPFAGLVAQRLRISGTVLICPATACSIKWGEKPTLGFNQCSFSFSASFIRLDWWLSQRL